MSHTVTIDPAVIEARKKLIADDAGCIGCGSSRADCERSRENNTDPTAPPWFGCCAMGTGQAPCRHRSDPDATASLLEEIQSGNVRPAEDIVAERERRREDRRKARGPITGSIYAQGEWWRQKSGEWIRIADMAPSHRENAAAMLLRQSAVRAMRAGFAELAIYRDAPEDVVNEWLTGDERRLADPEAWMRGTALHRALTGPETQEVGADDSGCREADR